MISLRHQCRYCTTYFQLLSTDEKQAVICDITEVTNMKCMNRYAKYLRKHELEN